MKAVLIIEAQMKHYRAPFYARLNDCLRADGIRLSVAYSDPPKWEVLKQDCSDLPLAYGLRVKGYWLWPRHLLYQPLLRSALAADLVIADEGNRFVLNHLFLQLCRIDALKLALWGHGQNRQTTRLRLSEWYRRRRLQWPSWWFTYTKGTASYLRANGVPETRITVVQNAVDTHEIRDLAGTLSAEDRSALRFSLGIPRRARVGIFCGTISHIKNLPFLIESSKLIKAQVPDFHLVLVGGGPKQGQMQALIAGLAWVHWVGPKFGKEKARLLAISDAFLLPGAVGLAILDSFAAGLPILTTRHAMHGPEIEYLEEGVNGMISDAHPHAFSEAAVSLFRHKELITYMQNAATKCQETFSIENMVVNFSTGIRSCLQSTR